MIIQTKKQAAYGKYTLLILVFAVGFLVAYTVCLFSPLRDDIVSTLRPGEPVTEAMLNFQWKFAGIGALAGSMATLVFFFMKKNKAIIIKLVFNDDDHMLELHSTGLFTSKSSQLTIRYDALRVVFEKKATRLSVHFFDGNTTCGEISNDDGVWENEPVKFRQVVSLLREICPNIEEKKH